MSTSSKTILPPASPKRTRAERYSKGPQEWKTLNWGKTFLSTSRTIFLASVAVAGVRTRQLPGEKHARYHREDLERLAREAIRGGVPESQKPA